MKKATIIIKNAKIYTIDNKNSIKEAMVIDDNKIIYLGSNEEVEHFITEDSKVIDVGKKVILPGFVDSHIHPPGTALTDLYEVSLYGLNSIEEYKDTIIKFIKNIDITIPKC